MYTLLPPPKKNKKAGLTTPNVAHFFFERKVPEFQIIILNARHSEDKPWKAAKERVVKDGRKDLSGHPNLLIKHDPNDGTAKKRFAKEVRKGEVTPDLNEPTPHIQCIYRIL